MAESKSSVINSGVIGAEVKKRRTFAIISHPDAGKTTLTEKVLLYSGQIRLAGEIKAKSSRSKTASDWMEIEKERGISISSSVMRFEYEDLKINLLDTPGHKDFGEDTYRTLMAADSTVMLMDAAKGVEMQTKKLFDICRLRDLPIFTFINKMDRDALDPLELIEQVEKTLNIKVLPLTWPIGMGDRFKGVYNRLNKTFHFFQPAEKLGTQASEETLSCAVDDPALLKYIDEEEQLKLQEDIELLEVAVGEFDHVEFKNGKVTPTLFGSARNNFGISTFLDIFKRFAPEPSAKKAKPKAVEPDSENFSAFVFKIQANMDKSHRDRLAFMRICSGHFERDMDVKIARGEKKIRLSHSKQIWAQSRETIEEAFSGDIIGVHDPGHFRIGDTVFTGKKIEFEGIPQFSPEVFGKIELKDPIKRKQLQKGIQELCEEGLVQIFSDPKIGMQDPVLGVVGVLQFEVLLYRLKDEYNVECSLRKLPYSMARWMKPKSKELDLTELDLRVPLLKDANDHWVCLFNTEWELNFIKKNTLEKVHWYLTSPIFDQEKFEEVF